MPRGADFVRDAARKAMLEAMQLVAAQTTTVPTPALYNVGCLNTEQTKVVLPDGSQFDVIIKGKIGNPCGPVIKLNSSTYYMLGDELAFSQADSFLNKAYLLVYNAQQTDPGMYVLQVADPSNLVYFWRNNAFAQTSPFGGDPDQGNTVSCLSNNGKHLAYAEADIIPIGDTSAGVINLNLGVWANFALNKGSPDVIINGSPNTPYISSTQQLTKTIDGVCPAYLSFNTRFGLVFTNITVDQIVCYSKTVNNTEEIFIDLVLNGGFSGVGTGPANTLIVYIQGIQMSSGGIGTQNNAEWNIFPTLDQVHGGAVPIELSRMRNGQTIGTWGINTGVSTSEYQKSMPQLSDGVTIGPNTNQPYPSDDKTIFLNTYVPSNNFSDEQRIKTIDTDSWYFQQVDSTTPTIWTIEVQNIVYSSKTSSFVIGSKVKGTVPALSQTDNSGNYIFPGWAVCDIAIYNGVGPVS